MTFSRYFCSLFQVSGLALSIAALTACGGSGGSGGGNDANDSNTVSGAAQGVVQKGPFQPGGDATLQSLAGDGSLGGDSVTGEIVDNGEYQIPDASWQGAALLTLSGTYFDETDGTFSGDTRTLHAVLGVPADTRSNVNLYTHLTAARTRQRMSDGDGFSDAHEQASNELKGVVGITEDPDDLDVLGQGEDSANLLLFSAASLEAGIDQAGLDALAADFADDGQINGSLDGSGSSVWSSIRQAASDTPDLLTDARNALESQYSETPPRAGSGNPAWMLSACEAAKLTDSRVLCTGDTFYGEARDSSNDDSGEFYTFIPEHSGHYTVELFGDASKPDDNTNLCSWTVYSDDSTSASELGDSTEDGAFCGVEDVTTLRLSGGSTYYLYPQVTQEDELATAYFKLSVKRNAEGKEMKAAAREIKQFPYDGYVGILINTSTESYYRFTAQRDGQHTITLGSYICSGSSYLELTLHDKDGFGSDLASSGDDACSQSIDASLEAGQEYYLTVQNWMADSWNRTSFRAAPGRIDFTLDVQ